MMPLAVAELAEPGDALPPGTTMVGMPQLALGGLSESWLLKECGHRHWLMLARSFGQVVPDFRDRDGARVYATFTAVSVSDARLDLVEENDVLLHTGHLAQVSRTQFQSVQRIAAGKRTVARVAMTSVFLRRTREGDNLSVARTMPLRVPAAPAGGGLDRALTEAAYAFRDGSWTEHLGFRRADRETLAVHTLEPCPSQDFNGAGFLYFASFQGFLDRAEWAFFGRAALGASTVRRDLFYTGNANPGDALTVRLCGERWETGGLSHWCEIRRASDDARIAEAITVRRLVAR